jgi:hypothetical protein
MHNVAWRLKAGVTEPEEIYITKQRLGKHVPMATSTQATLEEFLGTVFSVGSSPRLYRVQCSVQLSCAGEAERR